MLHHRFKRNDECDVFRPWAKRDGVSLVTDQSVVSRSRRGRLEICDKAGFVSLYEARLASMRRYKHLSLGGVMMPILSAPFLDISRLLLASERASRNPDCSRY